MNTAQIGCVTRLHDVELLTPGEPQCVVTK